MAGIPAAGLIVAFLDSGQGDTNLIVFPNGQLMLIDCGCKKNSDVVRPQVVQALNRYLGHNHHRFDWVVITHGDEDHYNMLLPVLAATGAACGTVWYGGDISVYANAHDHNATQNWLRAHGQPLGPAHFGGAAPLAVGGVNVYILAANSTGDPKRRDGWGKNTNSIVLMFEYAGYKVFMMADSTSDTETFILARAAAPGAPAGLLASTHSTLKLGHHGSTTSSSQAWVAAVAPNAIVASADTRLFSGTGMPKKSHVNDIVAWSTRVVAAGNHGVVVFDDLATRRFVQVADTTAVCSTLFSIVYNHDGSAYETAGGSWYLTVRGDGSVSLDNTG